VRPIPIPHCQRSRSYQSMARAHFCAALVLLLLLGVTCRSSAQSTTAGVKINGPVPWIDVTTYGAKGDGSTDDSTAINNAISMGCPTNTSPSIGCTVFFPQGTYKINSAITIAYTVPGVKLMGQCAVIGVGSSCSQITSGMGIYMVQVGQSSLLHDYNGFDVRDLQFTDLSGTGAVSGAIQLYAVNNFRVDSIYCNNFKGRVRRRFGGLSKRDAVWNHR
jgi:hypothetical protein